MADAVSERSTRSITRRGLLIATPCVAIAGVGLGTAMLNRVTDTPISLGALGPFREVFLTPRDDQSDLDIAIAYPFGERHNTYGEGLAHYLEHLVWQSVRSAGADGGRHSNAWTSPQATLYWLSRSPDAMQDAIERLAASAAPLVVDEAYAIQERDIVQREFDLRRLENPMDAPYVEMAGKLFGDSAYARTTLGSKSSISRFTLEAARKLHDETHHLSSAKLHLRGPVAERDVVRAIEWIEHWPTPRAEALKETVPVWSAAPEDVANRTVPGLSRPLVVKQKSFLPPPNFTWAELFAARNILVNLALSTKAGGLARPLRYDAFLAASFDLGLDPLGKAGLFFWISAEPDQNVSLNDLNDALDKELARLFGEPNETSFYEVRDRELSSLNGILDPLKANDERLFNSLISGAAYVTLAELRAAVRNMTFARFQTFIQHFLKPRSAVSRLISVS
jgi:predicted Zn-dependent peptidase